MIRRPPRSTQSRSSAASDVYKRQAAVMDRVYWAGWSGPPGPRLGQPLRNEVPDQSGDNLLGPRGLPEHAAAHIQDGHRVLGRTEGTPVADVVHHQQVSTLANRLCS